MNTNVLDVRSLIDDGPLRGYQKLVVFFCFVIIAIDGFDVVAMGLVAPVVMQEWGVSVKQMGPVLSSALFGLAAGALTAGPLADRFGRKVVLVSSVAFFGICTIFTAYATDVEQMIFWRFLTGLGLGAAAPNAATLTSEFAPQRQRSFLVTIAFSGFSLGAAAGGFLAAWIIPNLGWRSVLLLGGVMPIALLPFLIFKMPESVTFLIAKNKAKEKIRNIIEKIVPGSTSTATDYTMSTATAQKGGLSLIVSKNYLLGTTMLWVMYFMSLFLIYLCSSWLPTLIKLRDFSISEAAIVASLFQIGGPLGCLFWGWMMDRFRPHTVLVGAMLIGAVTTYLIGQVDHNLILICALAWMLGFCFNGGSVGMTALAIIFYPTEARATGASWMNGIGRFGAILSAFVGAYMITAGYQFSTMFTLLTIPAVLAAIAITIKGFYNR